jgi:hypothetical protein
MKCDQKRLIAGIRLTVMHATGIINVKMVKRTRVNFKYKINCDAKKMREQSLMVLV